MHLEDFSELGACKPLAFLFHIMAIYRNCSILLWLIQASLERECNCVKAISNWPAVHTAIPCGCLMHHFTDSVSKNMTDFSGNH